MPNAHDDYLAHAYVAPVQLSDTAACAARALEYAGHDTAAQLVRSNMGVTKSLVRERATVSQRGRVWQGSGSGSDSILNPKSSNSVRFSGTEIGFGSFCGHKSQIRFGCSPPVTGFG